MNQTENSMGRQVGTGFTAQPCHHLLPPTMFPSAGTAPCESEGWARWFLSLSPTLPSLPVLLPSQD